MAINIQEVRIIIDNKQREKFREPYDIHDASALLWNVAAAGKRPPEVTCHKFLSDFYKR